MACRVLDVVRATLVSLALTASAAAVEVTLPALQSGGFYADGGADNDLAFENYFVGYGTTPGFARTAERRSFFHFDLAPLAGLGAVTSATLKLRLPFGGLIFGKGPGDPAAGPLPSDAVEVFALGAVHVPSAVVTSPTLTIGEVLALFAMIDDFAVAAPHVFGAAPLPDPGDGGPPIVTIALDAVGLAELSARLGADIVLGGWMPSWSEDLRLVPGSGDLVEGSELIFGLTDVHKLELLRPLLTVTFAAPAVPLPGSAWLLLAAAAGARFVPRRRATSQARLQGTRARAVA